MDFRALACRVNPAGGAKVRFSVSRVSIGVVFFLMDFGDILTLRVIYLNLMIYESISPLIGLPVRWEKYPGNARKCYRY